jgi:hypothetical protein
VEALDNVIQLLRLIFAAGAMLFAFYNADHNEYGKAAYFMALCAVMVS